MIKAWMPPANSRMKAVTRNTQRTAWAGVPSVVRDFPSWEFRDTVAGAVLAVAQGRSDVPANDERLRAC
jgi:hypothetical protein